MKAIKKLLIIALALAMVAAAIPDTSVQAANGIEKSKNCYAGKTFTLNLTTPSSWKNVKTTWTKENGTGKVTLSSKKTKSVKVKAVKEGNATVKATVSYTKNGKVQTKTYTCKITVKAADAAPKLVKVEKYYDPLSVIIQMTFDGDIDEDTIFDGDIKKVVAENFEITLGKKTYTKASDLMTVDFWGLDEGSANVVTLALYVSKPKSDAKKDITITIKDSATICGTNGVAIAPTDSAITAVYNEIELY